MRIWVASLDHAGSWALGIGAGDDLIARSGNTDAGREGRTGLCLGDAGDLPSIGDKPGKGISPRRLRSAIDVVDRQNLAAIEAGGSMVREPIVLIGPDE